MEFEPHEIVKTFTFEASHSLPMLPSTHKCHHQHGHSYEIAVAVQGPLMPGLGWVQDYAVISAYTKPLIEQLDHKHLNDVLSAPTTAENLATWFAERLAVGLPLLSRVEVRETRTSNVILRVKRS